jgi:hypothetical protein
MTPNQFLVVVVIAALVYGGFVLWVVTRIFPTYG